MEYEKMKFYIHCICLSLSLRDICIYIYLRERNIYIYIISLCVTCINRLTHRNHVRSVSHLCLAVCPVSVMLSCADLVKRAMSLFFGTALL